MNDIFHVMTRKKVLDERLDAQKQNKLARRLGTGDLIALGVGGTLGLAVYVLAGHVAKEVAGPSVVLSFLIAAVASLFAGLCYAELGARVPQAGSAYVYSYVCVGEFIAFVIGWNLILEYAIGSASVARGISLYLDNMLDGVLKKTFEEIVPMYSTQFLSPYFDLFAFGLVLLLGVGVAFGMKKSALVNNIFTVTNICVVVFVIVAGSIKANTDNWKISGNSSDASIGQGGFFPFGYQGMLKGAAICFFGFVGFDCIATLGEEVHNPRKAIPVSIISSLIIIFLAYFGISTILTLMLPYYELDSGAPIPHAFAEIGWDWAKWIVAVGGMFGLLASLLGSMLPLPRILYSMACDGLVFHIFGEISTRFKTPVAGTLLASLLTAILAGLFDLSQLVNMMSIGTLMAYTIVAACVLLLRFERDTTVSAESVRHESSYLMNHSEKYSLTGALKQLFNCTRSSEPSRMSSSIVGCLVTFYCICCFALGLCLIHWIDDVVAGSTVAVTITCLFGVLMVFCIFFITLQPRSKSQLTFQVPLVPLLPCLSIFINIYLMLMLDSVTWIRFAVWLVIGLAVYLISLCIYDRGSNYLIHAQKSSINGKISGNLNYAFENMAECQERATSFVTDFKIVVQPPTPTDSKSNMSNNISIEPQAQSEEIIYIQSNGFLPLTEEEILNQRAIDESDSVALDIETTTIVEKEIILDSYEEIELLDQVLKDEEEASGLSSLDDDDILEDVPIQNISLYPEKSQNIPESPIVNRELSNGDGDLSLSVSSEHSVVVLVHRENVVQHKKSIGAVSLISDTEDNVSTINEDVNVRDVTDSPVEEPIVITDDKMKEEKIFIPVPPPMDESYFASTLPVMKWRVVKPKINDQNYINPNEDGVLRKKEETFEDETVNPGNSDHLKFGTDQQHSFMDKLNILLKKPSSRFKKNNVLKQSNSSHNLELQNVNTTGQTLDYVQDKGKYKSEPNLMSALKLEISQFHSDRSTPEKSPVLSDKLNITAPNSLKLRTTSQSRKNSLPNNPDTASQPNFDSTDGDTDSLSKLDLKRKLESIFSVNPSMRRQAPKKKDPKPPIVNDEVVEPGNTIPENGESVVKARPKENYTNTMKLQRARFDNVLKSIQSNNDSRRESEASIIDIHSDNSSVDKLKSDD